MAEIAHWRPDDTDRDVAPGHNLMTIKRLDCLFKISLECIRADL